MDRKTQHQINAGIERHFLDDAERDKRNLEREGHALIAKGMTVRGNFDLQEARNAGSWITKRQGILRREERLAGK
jgi:hypothetical protein